MQLSDSRTVIRHCLTVHQTAVSLLATLSNFLIAKNSYKKNREFPQALFLLNTFESLLCQLHYSTNKVTSASKVFSAPCQLPRLSRSHIVYEKHLQRLQSTYYARITQVMDGAAQQKKSEIV